MEEIKRWGQNADAATTTLLGLLAESPFPIKLTQPSPIPNPTITTSPNTPPDSEDAWTMKQEKLKMKLPIDRQKGLYIPECAQYRT